MGGGGGGGCGGGVGGGEAKMESGHTFLLFFGTLPLVSLHYSLRLL